MNITEADLIKTYNVGDLIDSETPVIEAGTPLSKILNIFANTSSFFYPVVDKTKKLVGAITMDGVRNTFVTTEINDWLIALDIMEPIVAKTAPDVPLTKALKKSDDLDILDMPVVDEKGAYLGVINARNVRRKISTILLEKQKEADARHAQL
jgi:CBS domain-containing protein